MKHFTVLALFALTLCAATEANGKNGLRATNAYGESSDLVSDPPTMKEVTEEDVAAAVKKIEAGALRDIVLVKPPKELVVEATEEAAAEGVPTVHNTITNEIIELNGDNLPYPGIDVLGIGYSLVHGNPAGDPNTRKVLYTLVYMLFSLKSSIFF